MFEREKRGREKGRRGRSLETGLGPMKLYMGSGLQDAASRGHSKTLRRRSPSCWEAVVFGIPVNPKSEEPLSPRTRFVSQQYIEHRHPFVTIRGKGHHCQKKTREGHTKNCPRGTKTVLLSQAYFSTPLAQKDLRASSTQTLCPTEDKIP